MAACEGCAGCPLKNRAHVGSFGNDQADFMIVGEAPGEQELLRGRPFTGPSGKLLWGALEKAGMDRPDAEYFVSNALQCRPLKTPSTGIPREMIDSCRKRLMEEVNLAPRKVILALGNSAIRALTGNHQLKITQIRGKVFDVNGAMVIPTLHPAAILRQQTMYRLMIKDFRYAVELYKGAVERDPGDTKYVVINTPELLDRAIKTLRTVKLLAADIETTGFNPREHELLCLGIAWAKNKVMVFPAHLVPQLAPLFNDHSVKWLWHNGKFDTQFLRKLGLDARVDEDTMLAHYVLDEQQGHGLKDLSTDYLGAPDYEVELKIHFEYEGG